MLETLVAPTLALEAAFWYMIEDYDGAGEHAVSAAVFSRAIILSAA